MPNAPIWSADDRAVRQRADEPPVETHWSADLDQVAAEAEAVGVQERHLPAAEEHGGDHRRDEDDLDELGEEEHAEAHAGVLDEVADDLGLALGQVERRALGLGDRRGDEQDERQRLRTATPVERVGAHLAMRRPSPCSRARGVPTSRKQPISDRPIATS